MTSGPQSDTRTIVTDTRTAVRNTRAGKFRSDMSLPDPINKKKLARLNNLRAIFLCASFYISVGFSEEIFFDFWIEHFQLPVSGKRATSASLTEPEVENSIML